MPTKKSNLKELTDKELAEKLKEERAHYTRLQFNHTVSQIESPTHIRKVRREVARLKTEIRQREIAASNS